MITLTHVSERSFGGRRMKSAGGRRQLRGAIALCHVHYSVGVAPSWFASITLWEAWAIASENDIFIQLKAVKVINDTIKNGCSDSLQAFLWQSVPICLQAVKKEGKKYYWLSIHLFKIQCAGGSYCHHYISFFNLHISYVCISIFFYILLHKHFGKHSMGFPKHAVLWLEIRIVSTLVKQQIWDGSSPSELIQNDSSHFSFPEKPHKVWVDGMSAAKRHRIHAD